RVDRDVPRPSALGALGAQAEDERVETRDGREPKDDFLRQGAVAGRPTVGAGMFVYELVRAPLVPELGRVLDHLRSVSGGREIHLLRARAEGQSHDQRESPSRDDWPTSAMTASGARRSIAHGDPDRAEQPMTRRPGGADTHSLP